MHKNAALFYCLKSTLVSRDTGVSMAIENYAQSV